MPLHVKRASVLPGANWQKEKQMNRVLKTAREKPQHPSTTVCSQGRMSAPPQRAACSLTVFLQLPQRLSVRISSCPTISVIQEVQNHN